MNIQVLPGKHIVAVSGGVDSMALLHVLRAVPGVELVVAHFDHGIRPDSGEDRLLVQKTAEHYGLPFVCGQGNLGPEASEEAARKARYAFLRKVRQEYGADAIVTAHHKDDVLETAIINIIRGTGRKGLSSLGETDEIKRPLLQTPKADIRAYAEVNSLKWHEDSTNTDHSYLRNHIRHNILTRLSDDQKERFYTHIARAKALNDQIDILLDDYINSQKIHGQLCRQSFILLPHKVSLEVMAAWLRAQGIRSFDKKMLERLVRGAKILVAGSFISLNKTAFLRIGKEFLALDGPER